MASEASDFSTSGSAGSDSGSGVFGGGGGELGEAILFRGVDLFDAPEPIS